MVVDVINKQPSITAGKHDNARKQQLTLSDNQDGSIAECCWPGVMLQHTSLHKQSPLHVSLVAATSPFPAVYIMVPAGSATIKVYYYGWWVLTASGAMCEPPTSAAATTAVLKAADDSSSISTAHRRSLLRHGFSSHSWSTQTRLAVQPHLTATDSSSSSLQLTVAALRDDTCVMPQGPLQLHHDASLPAVAPRGNYRMQLSAADVNNGMELFCLDVWFKVAS